MRTAGDTSSSYCPDFTDHKKAIRNPVATNKLAVINISITFIAFTKLKAAAYVINDSH
jgi:hypothetical protein